MYLISFVQSLVNVAEFYTGLTVHPFGRAGMLTDIRYSTPLKQAQNCLSTKMSIGLDKQIKSLRNEIRNQTHYNGKPTRRYKRLQRLRDRQERADHLRWTPQYMPMAVKKLFTDSGIE